MRILNVLAQKPDSTGSGVFLAEMVASQVAEGHEVAVVCGIDAEDEITTLPGASLVRPVRFRTEELPFPVCGMSDVMPYEATRYRDLAPAMADQFEAAFTRAIREVEEAFEPEVVLCHHLYYVTALVRELLPQHRVGAICHSTDLRQLRSHGLQRDRIAAAVRRLDAVFALHEAQREDIQRLLAADPARVHVVGTGYNPQLFNSGTRSFEPRGARPLRLIFVGKVTFKKGVHSLVRALDMVEVAQGIELDIVGGSDDPAELAEVEALAAASPHEVRLRGKMSQTALAEAYRRADVFVLPSFYEGLPLVLVEALACGCRGVVTDLPGLRPWLESSIPDCPVEYVAMPPMASLDEPDRAGLAAFAERLARAIEASQEPLSAYADTSAVSWKSLTRRCTSLLTAV